MAIKRSELIDADNADYYHLINRCVRRALLCGKDPVTNKYYGYRIMKKWLSSILCSFLFILYHFKN